MLSEIMQLRFKHFHITQELTKLFTDNGTDSICAGISKNEGSYLKSVITEVMIDDWKEVPGQLQQAVPLWGQLSHTC